MSEEEKEIAEEEESKAKSLSKDETDIDVILSFLNHKSVGKRGTALLRLGILSPTTNKNERQIIVDKLRNSDIEEESILSDKKDRLILEFEDLLESDISKVVELLINGITPRRIIALRRLKELFITVSDNEAAQIVKELKFVYTTATHSEILSGSKELYQLYIDNPLKSQRKNLKKRLEEEEKMKVQALIEQKRMKKQALIEQKRIEEENKKREQERKIFFKKLISEELNELEDHSYISMESKNRFPYHTYYISIIRTTSALVLIVFAIFGLFLLEDSLFLAFVSFLYGAIMFFLIMLSSEIIRLILDFHDSNYTNTKVRIKTLKVLEDISKSLKK
jgi:hypothetical protein